MNLSRFFVDRPIFAGVISVAIFLAGLISVFQLPISEYPEVVPPSVVVRASFPGANPKVIAETVATPLEEQIQGVENMLYMSSQAASDGNLTLTVTFKLGTDPNLAQQLVQNRVNQALPRLPEVTRNLGVTTTKSSPDLTMVVHLISPNKRYDTLYLRNYAVLNVKDQLAKIDGVGSVQLFGSGDYAMRIWLNPEKMAERGISASELVDAVRKQNVQVAAGVINGPPYSKDGELQLPITAHGRLSDPEQFDQIIIKRDNGVITRLKDVARVELNASQYGLRSLLDNQPAVAIPIFQAPGSNAIAISDNVRATMEKLKANFPPGLEYRIVYDPTVFVRGSITAVVHTLLEAIALVVLVVILFLQTWRASIIPLLAVPVSIIGTFAAMLMFGFSINALSLFGLVLAIGIVVDDAIVVVENVQRGVEEGLSPRDATLRAMREVTGPIIAIALVLCAVFVPVAFISGLTGEFYRQFALTIAFSTIISAFNSLTLSPALAALLLRSPQASKDKLTLFMDRAFGPVFRGFNRFFRSGSEKYGHGVQGVLRHKGRSVTVYAVLLGLTFVALELVPRGFVPLQDKQYLVSFAQLPQGATLDRTEKVIRQMSAIALKEPGVEGAVAVGAEEAVGQPGRLADIEVFVAVAVHIGETDDGRGCSGTRKKSRRRVPESAVAVSEPDVHVVVACPVIGIRQPVAVNVREARLTCDRSSEWGIVERAIALRYPGIECRTRPAPEVGLAVAVDVGKARGRRAPRDREARSEGAVLLEEPHVNVAVPGPPPEILPTIAVDVGETDRRVGGLVRTPVQILLGAKADRAVLPSESGRRETDAIRAALLNGSEPRAAGGAIVIVSKSVFARQVRAGVALDSREPLHAAQHEAGFKASGSVGPRLVSEGDGIVRGESLIVIAGVVNARRAIIAIRVVLRVRDRVVIADAVHHFIERPHTHAAAAWRLYPGVWRDTVFQRQPVLAVHLEIRRVPARIRLTGCIVGNHTLPRFVSRVIDVRADVHEAFAIETKTIVRVVVHAATEAIEKDIRGAAMDDRESAERPAVPEHAVAGLAIVHER